MQTVALDNGRLHAEILPHTGAGLARLDWVARGAPVPLLRPYIPGDTPPRVNQLGCFLLVPWSNRLDGGFTFDGVHYPIAPNREGEPYPIHGEGWQFPWQVEDASNSAATLVLERRGTPYSFKARAHYALLDDGLEVTLSVDNLGERILPFGLGLHPYLPRSAGVTLQARADTLWAPGPHKLQLQMQEVPQAWSFAQPRTLPPEVIDHVFEGWDGRAEVHWPEHGLRLAIEADTRYYIVYTPAGADFFCFEPVDHRIAAHHGEGGPERHGLSLLAPGATLQRQFRFTVAA